MKKDSDFDNSLLIKYKKAISNFEAYIKDIYYKNPYGLEYKGYLINLKHYEKLKKISGNYKINKYDCGITFKINQIEFKTSQYLVNMLLNGNKYIFINLELWELICDKDKKYESPITYKVNSIDITFNLDDIELSFSHNKNIIDYIGYKNNYYKSFYEQIKKIYDSVVIYYNFEKEILNDLKNKQYSNTTTYEYLISKNWIDKWKLFSNYENIKKIYLDNNINLEYDIMNYLIYYFENNKINYNELLESINIRTFIKKEELESYLKNDSLVLIDSNFLFCFEYDYSGKSMKYNVFNNKINIYFMHDEILSFKSNNNIISINGLINYSHLKQIFLII